MNEELIKNTIIPKNDGIDHINIYSKGLTQLGRILSNMFNIKFSIKIFNDTNELSFRNIESLYHYLRLRLYITKMYDNKDLPVDDYCNKLNELYELFEFTNGYQARELNKKFKLDSKIVDTIIESIEFKTIILQSIVIKLNLLTENQLQLFINNELNFHHYWYYGNIDNPKVYYLFNQYWMIDFISYCSNRISTNSKLSIDLVDEFLKGH